MNTERRSFAMTAIVWSVCFGSLMLAVVAVGLFAFLNTADMRLFRPAEKTLVNLNKLSEETYFDQVSTVKNTTELVKLAYDAIWDVRAGLMGGKTSDKRLMPGVIPEATLLLRSVREETSMLRQDLQRLVQSAERVSKGAEEVLRPLSGAMINVERLTAQLEKEIALNSKEVQRTAQLLQQAIIDADKLIADPNIGKTIAHVEHSAETVSIAMEPWRKQANRVLAVLKFIAGRFTMDIWR